MTKSVNMLTRPRLRSRGGCNPCKRNRKKCDEQKPTCGACQRINRHCTWIPGNESGEGHNPARYSDPVFEFFIRRLRQEPTLSKSIDLSAFQDRLCASHALEICFKSSNSPFDPIDTQRNGWSIQSTLTFAPTDGSLSWDCFLAHGLMFVGNRYQNCGLFEAGLTKHSLLVRKLRDIIENEDKRRDYDTLAAISNLGTFSATRSWNGRVISASDSLGVGHAAGMLAILETMQPQQFQNDRALAFFEHTRFTKIAAAILSKRKTCLTSESWKQVPWAQAKHTKNSLHRLIDLLCEIVDLQSELHILTPYEGFDCNLSARTNQEKIEKLLSKLYDWRQSIEPALRSRLQAVEKATQSDSLPESCSSQAQSEQSMSLCELGIFNMILIYLCRFLAKGEPVPRAADALVNDKSGNLSPEARLATRMTSLKLPIEDPYQRAYLAAKEIFMIWETMASNGLIGVATMYLGLPMLLARSVLAYEGDAAFTELNRALDRMPAFWSGPGCYENRVWHDATLAKQLAR